MTTSHFSSPDYTQRPLSPSEASYVSPGTPVTVAYTIHGELNISALRKAVRLLPAHHPVLAAQIEHTSEGLVLRAGLPNDAPELTVIDDVDRATSPFAPGDALLRVTLQPHNDGSHTVFVAVHHAISDGISVLALHELLWRIYTALTAGQRWETPLAEGLPKPVEELVRQRHTEADVAAYRASPASYDNLATPVTIPAQTDPSSDSGIHYHRIELQPHHADQLKHLALKAQIGVNAILFGILATAARSCVTPADESLPLTCMLTMDLRSRTTPRIPRDHMVYAVAVAYTSVQVNTTSSAWDVGRDIWGQLGAALVHRIPERELLAFPDPWERATARNATMLISSLVGRCPSLTLPTGVRASGPRFVVEPPAMFPAAALSDSPNGAIGIDLLQPKSRCTPEQARLLADAVQHRLTTIIQEDPCSA